MKSMRLAAAAVALLVSVEAAPAQQNVNKAGSLFTGLQGGSNLPIQVEADALEVSQVQDQRVSSFRGNVTVRRSDTVLKAAAVTIYSAAAGAPKADKDGFSKIEATGQVFINQADQTATAEAATFDARTQIAIMTGNVVLSQGTNVITGDRLVVDLSTSKARVEKTAGGAPIRGIFTPGAGDLPGSVAKGGGATPPPKPGPPAVTKANR